MMKFTTLNCKEPGNLIGNTLRLLLVSSILCLSIAINATSVEYATTDLAALTTAIKGSDVDTCILTTSGGIYDFSGYITIYSSKVIIGKEGLASNPLIINSTQGSSSAAIFNAKTPSTSKLLILENVDVDLDASGTSLMLVKADSSVNIELRNCHITDANNASGALRLNKGESSVSIDNCLITDCDDRFIDLYTPDAIYGDITISNSTFNNITGGCLVYFRSSGTYAIANNININHCTFKNVGTGEVVRYSTGAIQDGATVEFKNNVFVDVDKLVSYRLHVSDYNYLGDATANSILSETNSFAITPLFGSTPDTFQITNTSDFICGDGGFAGDQNWYDVMTYYAAGQSADPTPLSNVTINSNKVGIVYLIKDDVDQSTLSDLEAAIAANNGAKSNITTPNTAVSVLTNALNAGTYYAYAVDADENISTKGLNSILVNTATLTKQITPQENVNVYYNKAATVLTVEFKDERKAQIEVYDLSGQRIALKISSQSISHIHLNDKKGIMIVRISTDNTLISKKIAVY